MRHIVKEMNEKGQLHQLSKKWELKQPNCQPAHRKGTALGFGKLITLFLEITLGVILTLILFFAEKIHSIFKKNPGYNEALKIILKDITEILQRSNITNVELNLLIEKTNLLIETTANKLKK